jgi:hypothetical protein
LTPEQVKNIPKEELEIPPNMEDFEMAIKKVNKSVSKQDLEKYQNWMKKRQYYINILIFEHKIKLSIMKRKFFPPFYTDPNSFIQF